jgi:hypothetical protein
MHSNQIHSASDLQDVHSDGIDESVMIDHLMDHFATWYLVTVLSIDLTKIIFHHYQASHQPSDPVSD